MKRLSLVTAMVLLSLLLCSCSLPLPSISPIAASNLLISPLPFSPPVVSPPPYSIPPSPPVVHTPTPPSFIPDVPSSLGVDPVFFDIYHRQALVDLNGDGGLDQLVYDPGSKNILINGLEYNIGWFEQIGDDFAIVDVDRTDGLLEIVITMADNDALYTDYEVFYYMSSRIYWWNGTDLKDMGKIGNLCFDGHYRAAFDPSKFFDGAGLVQGVAFSDEFSPLYYRAHYRPDGADRKFAEENYVTKILQSQPNFVLKPGNYCLLLPKISTSHFGLSYNPDWDYTSYLYALPRINPWGDGTITVIAQGGEVLTPVRVYGKYWLKLKTFDNLQGWIKCKDSKIYNYYQIMNLTADDMFEDLHMAP